MTSDDKGRLPWRLLRACSQGAGWIAETVGWIVILWVALAAIEGRG